MNFLRKLFGLDRPAAPPTRGRDRGLDLKGLEKVLKYQFRNPDLARTAMTHRSYLHASQGRSGESNERMEFLGDSVVGLAVNEFSRARMAATDKELREEREGVKDLI